MSHLESWDFNFLVCRIEPFLLLLLNYGHVVCYTDGNKRTMTPLFIFFFFSLLSFFFSM